MPSLSAWKLVNQAGNGRRTGDVFLPDLATITKHLEQLVFYYGTTDGCVPREHRDEIARPFPTHLDVCLDTHGAAHAFCLEHSAVVADAVVARVRGRESAISA
jgi:hypothetical protein